MDSLPQAYIVAHSILFYCFIVVILIAIFWWYYKNKDRKLRHAEILAAIEKGLPIPAELEKREKSKEELRRTLLLIGLITLFFGVGIFGFLYFFRDIKFASIGFIPIATGIGLLLSSLLFKEKK
jgi:hypothetical protein